MLARRTAHFVKFTPLAGRRMDGTFKPMSGKRRGSAMRRTGGLPRRFCDRPTGLRDRSIRRCAARRVVVSRESQLPKRLE